MVTSGEMNGVGTDAPIEEIYNPSTNSWSQLSSAPFPYSYYYPHNVTCYRTAGFWLACYHARHHC